MEIVFFALIAAFVLFRLFRTLGTYDENTEIKTDNIKEFLKEQKVKQNIIEIMDAFEASMPDHLRLQFDKFREIAPDFRAKDFLDKAKRAFEIIVYALNSHDKKALKPLLATPVFTAFEAEITRRQKEGQLVEMQVIGHNNSEIMEAQLDGTKARITLHFVTEQKFKGDKNSTIVEDFWTFEKDLRQNNPIWKLIKT